jgi:hypothetical protein
MKRYAQTQSTPTPVSSELKVEHRAKPRLTNAISRWISSRSRYLSGRMELRRRIAPS